jgi:hypothetical protein
VGVCTVFVPWVERVEPMNIKISHPRMNNRMKNKVKNKDMENKGINGDKTKKN